jgi:hypothetical protein
MVANVLNASLPFLSPSSKARFQDNGLLFLLSSVTDAIEQARSVHSGREHDVFVGSIFP